MREAEQEMASGQSSSMREALPDEPWGLVVVIAVIGFLLIGGILTSLSVYVSIMQPYFGWSEADMGGGPVMLLLGMSAGNLIVGRVMARFGVRGVFSFGTSVALCGWIAAGFVQSLPEFMAAMALAGMGAGIATIVPGIAVISQSFHRRRGLAIAFFIGACALASATMPIASRWLIDVAGWRQAFWIFGALFGVIGLPMLLRLPRSIGDTASHGAEGDQLHKPGLARDQVLKLPAFWLLTMVLTISQLGMNAILFNLIAYLRKTGFAASDAVTLFGITNFMSLPGLMIGGYMSDRVSAHILLPLILVFQSAGTFALLGVESGHPWQGHAPLIFFILLWGGVAGLPAQIGSMLLSEIIGQRAYTAMLGVIFTVNGFVGALAPAVMGWAYGVAGGYSWPIFIFACLCLLAACASLFCRASNVRNAALITRKT